MRHIKGGRGQKGDQSHILLAVHHGGPGTFNALGAVKIDMPNSYSVYMHDTNQRNLFNDDYHGCSQVDNVRDLATWLLSEEMPKWNRDAVDAAIATGAHQEVTLPKKVPVAWIYNAARDAIEIGGSELERSKKFRDVARTGRAAIVIDDLASTDPWRPRGIEVRGRAEALAMPTALIRIHPERIVSWGLARGRSARTVP